MARRPGTREPALETAGFLIFVALGFGVSCKKSEPEQKPAPSASAAASAAPFKLSPEQEKQVLARVGNRTITLGDYVATLERMDSFERLRYQSPERRRMLLKEMIDVELLAEEARRRGLDKLPETEERLRQALRDELLKELRREVPSPNDLPEADVRKYYEENRADFDEPERRRVSHIAVASRAEAEKLLAQARTMSAAEWGKLVRERSRAKTPKELGTLPVELAGDLGIVGPPGHPRGGNPRVPEPLREAVFKIDPKESVYPQVVEHEGKFHIVRMSGRTEPRSRSFAEAERTIRVALVQKLVKEREAALEKELRERYPVTIDDAALSKVKVPSPGAAGRAGG
ncbi:MAG: peptidylprolyl isomerase [Pseudomonadota bacterium]|nr:MAG: hypothetical protein DIU78_01600 [Pseudomonadota bacterium]